MAQDQDTLQNETELRANWCALIEEWTIKPQYLTCCGLARTQDGALFAAASQSGNPLQYLYKETYEATITQENGTDQIISIDEPKILKEAVTTMKAPLGIWLGGEKYKLVRVEEECKHNLCILKLLLCARPNGRCWIVVTSRGMIVVGLYKLDQEKTDASARCGILNFAEYLSLNQY